MKQCTECKWTYPDELVSPITIGRSGAEPQRAEVCGICALRLGNELHGISRERFTGTFAEELRQQAIQWRKRNKVEAYRGAE